MNNLDPTSSIVHTYVVKKLEKSKETLIEIGYELEKQTNRRIAYFVNDILNELESHVCRVALIGQIKAGKSSLINAMIERPDLLPTDINPSTAVATKLYFGTPTQENNTAMFHFFSDKEWENLMEGGRFETTAETFSALPLPKFTKRLEELKTRAEKRIGNTYQSNFGKHHLFSSVTPQLLEEYVSAGEFARDGSRKGVYSDITKIADVFLDGQPFSYPAVIIDTPGVNDPFFVRDELTSATLAGADVFLVVLSAQQPLSNADMALFRQLHGLQKNKIIAVVNRIDLLEDVTAEGQKILEHVRDQLKKELPAASVHVMLASALWKNTADRSDEDDLSQALTPTLLKYAVDQGYADAVEVKQWLGGNLEPEKLRRVLIKCSGIPDLNATIAKLIGTSVAEDRLLPHASTFSAIASNTTNSVRFGLTSLNPTAPIETGEENLYSAFKFQCQNNLFQLEELLSNIENILKSTEIEWTESFRADMKNLERYMLYTVEKFAEAQAQQFVKSESSRTFLANFQTETLKLRSEMAQDFARHSTDIYKNIFHRQREAEAKLRHMTKEVLPELEDILKFGLPSSQVRSASTLPLSKVTAFDINEFWEAMINQDKARTDPHGENFNRLIQIEFFNLLRELFQFAEADLMARLAEALRRLRFLTYSIIYPMTDQLQSLILSHQEWSSTIPEYNEELLYRFWQEFKGPWLATIAVCQAINFQIETVKKDSVY